MIRVLFWLAIIACFCSGAGPEALAQPGRPEIFVDPPLTGRPQNIVFDAPEAQVLVSDSEGMIEVRSTADWSVTARLGMLMQGEERPSWVSGFASLSPDGKRVLMVEHRLATPEGAIARIGEAGASFPRSVYLRPAALDEEYRAAWPEVSGDFNWLLMRFVDHPRIKPFIEGSTEPRMRDRRPDIYVAYAIKGDQIMPAAPGRFETADQNGDRVAIVDGSWTRSSRGKAVEQEVSQLSAQLDLPQQRLGVCLARNAADPLRTLLMTADGRLVQKRRDGITVIDLVALMQVPRANFSSYPIADLHCASAGKTSWFLYRRPADSSKNELWADDALNIVRIDHASGAVSVVSRHTGFAYSASQSGPDDSLLLLYDTRAFLYDSAGNERSFMASGGAISSLSWSPASRRLTVHPEIEYSTGGEYTPWWGKGRVRVLDFAEGGQAWSGPESDCGISGGLVLICEASRSFMSRWFRSLLRPADMKTFRIEERLLGGAVQSEAIFGSTPILASEDGTRIVARLEEKSPDPDRPVVLAIVDVDTGTVQKVRYDASYQALGNLLEPDFSFLFTPDLSRHLRIGLSHWTSSDAENTVWLVDTASGKRLAEWEYRAPGESGFFIAMNPAGTEVLYRTADAETGANEKLRLRKSDGTGGREIRLPDGQFLIDYDWRPEGDMLHTGETGPGSSVVVRTLDARSLALIRAATLPVDGLPGAYEFLDTGRLAIGTNTGAVHVFDLNSGQEQFRYYAAGDGEWIALTPEGYYTSSSPAVETLLRVRMNGTVTGISQYRERFFRPDIVQMAMNGQTLPASLMTLLEAAPPPRIRALTAGDVSAEGLVSLNFQIDDMGGGVGGVRLYNNDSAVQELGASEVDRGPQALTVRLKSGENRLQLVAFSRDGDAGSEPASLTLSWQPSAAPGTTLHVLAIGIQEFRNPVLSLTYPVADARMLADTLRTGSAGLFDHVAVEVLTLPEETSRAAILDAFQRYQRIAPDDAFVFYVASHGSVEGGDIQDREFMLYTSNVGLLSSEALRADAISQEEIRNFISNVPATRKLILLDTCHAGAIGDSLAARTRGVEEAGAVKALSRVTGTTILSASMAQQQAIEGYNGHGLFTWVLLEALKGKAAIEGSDRISNWNITSYVGRIVPELARARFGREQFPTVNDAGRQFDLVTAGPGERTAR